MEKSETKNSNATSKCPLGLCDGSGVIFDEKGIFIGTNIYNNSLIFIDRYSKKYKNSNMCIFGTSGAGKSFYTKLLILRCRILGVSQYVVDPEREYDKLCKSLNGTLIKLGPSSNTYINVLEIRKESIEDGENGYLAIKISKLIGFFNLIFGELNEEEKAILEDKIIKLYKSKGITFEDVSLYKKIKNKNKINLNPKFKTERDMPILEEFYELLDKEEKPEYFEKFLSKFILDWSKLLEVEARHGFYKNLGKFFTEWAKLEAKKNGAVP